MRFILLYAKHHWVTLWLLIFVIILITNIYGLLLWIRENRELKDTLGIFLSIVYYTLQVFTIESLPEGADNIYLKISKTLAPTLFIALSAGALIGFFIDRLRLFWASHFYREHWIVCGLSEATVNLIEALKKSGKKVIVLEENGENPHITYCKTAGIPYLISDSSVLISEKSLDRALGVGRSAGMFLIFEEDLKNIHMSQAVASQINADYKTFVHIVDYSLKHHYDKTSRWIGKVEVSYINLYEEMARSLFLRVPLDQGVNRVEKPWIIIIGTSEAGLALLWQAFKYKVYPGEKRLRLTLVGPKAQEIKEFVDSRFVMDGMNLFSALGFDLEVLQKRYELINSSQDLGIGEEKPQAIILCTQEDTQTERLRRELSAEKGVKVISLYSQHYMQGEGEHSFNMYSLAVSSLLNRNELDKMAELCHLSYLRAFFNIPVDSLWEVDAELRKEKYREELDMKSSEKPAINLWENLSEVYRNSNRNLADHIWEKLRAIDSYFNGKKDLTLQYIQNIEKALKDEKIVDLLAELEFKRYLRERTLLRDFEKLKAYKKCNFDYQKIKEEEKEEYNKKPIRENLLTILKDYAKP
ncbi:MAG: hypothetical protein ABDH18_00670 [Aquificaceae bacterium]